MLVKPAPPFRLLHRRLINVPALQARPYIRPDGINVKTFLQNFLHQLCSGDPVLSCCTGQCCLSNENETFLLDNETRSCCWAHAITCPPLTNKEGKKRGAGNDTSFGDSTGCCQIQLPGRTSRCSLYENERGLSTRTRSRCSLLLAELLKDGLLDRGPL